MSKIGRHINISNGFVSTAEYTKSLGYNCYQIFLGSPHSTSGKTQSTEDLLKLKSELKSLSMTIVIHGAYTINLCHTLGTNKSKNSINSLITNLNASVIIGKRCMGVIIHMGKNIAENNMSNEQALEVI